MEQLNLFGESSNIEDTEEFKKASIEIKKLRKEINYHSNLYYNQDAPEISDYEFDMLMNKLKALENKFPMLITSSSPTQKVGGTAKATFEEVNHAVPMQSLNDVFSYGEVEDFVNKITEEYGNEVEFVVETKIDGLSVSLEYEKGKLVRGSTRGNGLVGENITDNLLMLDDIKPNLKTCDTIELRGEVYLSKSRFEDLNDKLAKENKPLLANSRNAAAGTLRQLNSNIVKQRGLNIFVFNVQKSERKFETHSESLEYCKNIGVTTIKYSKLAKNVKEVIDYIKEIGKLRESLPYDIDGAVVKVNNLNLRESIGTTTKVPKWAVAYKYPPEEKETVLKEITLQVGRTGQVTPLAIIEPVRVQGSTISKCTLHNFDYIKEKDIRVGDVVKIKKAGDVIPEITTVVLNKRKEGLEKYIEPTVCPVCGELLEKEKGQVALRCVNSECEALKYREIEHFASRECMDIDGMGESVVERLIDSGLVQDVADIYYLKYEDIQGLDKFKEKSASNLIAAINKSKENSLDRLIFGLGIRHIGKKAAKILATKVENIRDFYHMDLETLSNIEDIGSIMAESIIKFFSKTKTWEIIDKLEKANVNLKGIKNDLESEKLYGMTVVITGSFDGITRDEIVKLLENNSAKVSSTVSKKTTCVIAGESAGSKLTKAQSLGVEICNLEEFKNKYLGD